MRPYSNLFFFALVLLIATARAATAAQITLADGSVLYGSIVSMADGEDLVVDTEHMDEVTIDWEAVVSLSDSQIVEIELFDGSEALGRVAVEGGQLLVDGARQLEIVQSDVFAITEVNDSFSERASAYTDIGSNFVRGNNRVTQLTFGAGAAYETTDWETYVRFSSIVNEQANADDTRRVTFNTGYDRNLNHGWLAGGYYQFESDEQQGLTGRSLIGVGAAKRVLNRRLHRLELLGGVALNVEEFDGLDRNESLEGVLGASYRLRWIVDTDLSFKVYPNLENSGRLRTEFDGSLGFDLLSDLDFRITVYDRYDSEPPLGNKKNDSGLTFGLRWDY